MQLYALLSTSHFNFVSNFNLFSKFFSAYHWPEFTIVSCNHLGKVEYQVFFFTISRRLCCHLLVNNINYVYKTYSTCSIQKQPSIIFHNSMKDNARRIWIFFDSKICEI